LNASLSVDINETPPFKIYFAYFGNEGHLYVGSLAGAAPC